MEIPRPMSPLLQEEIPYGADWGYQIKWDGVRLLSRIDKQEIQLFSKELRPKTSLYPEITNALGQYAPDDIWLDGEAIMYNTELQRPDFQKILQREKSRIPRPFPGYSIVYVLFDLLYANGQDLRSLPFATRFQRLQSLFPEKQEQLFVTDLFDDGEQLWDWISERGWEGMVSKRLSSAYRAGKRHRDWYKKKRRLLFEVEIIGIRTKNRFPSSLVMSLQHRYLGRVSSGLTTDDLRRLSEELQSSTSSAPAWQPLPKELNGLSIHWLDQPLHAQVSGLEVTASGLLRHPQLMKLRF